MPALTKNLALDSRPVRGEPDRRRVRGHATVRPRSSATSSTRAADAPPSDPAPAKPRWKFTLAVHLMTNTAVAAAFDIDGGQQLIEG